MKEIINQPSDKQLTVPGGGEAVRRSYILRNLVDIPFQLIFLWIVIRISNGSFLMIGRVLSIITICLLFWEIIFLFLVKIRLNFIDEIQIDENFIKLKIKNQNINLPIKDTKIYQYFGLEHGGSYIKYAGKWYFVPVIPNLYPVGTTLAGLPGHRDYHLWIPLIIFITAMIVFLIYLLNYLY